MLPVEHNDPINAKILAISEDKIEGFVREPFEEIARRSGVDVDVVMARIAAMLRAGTIRRVRQTLLATNLADGALVAWKVPEDKIDERVRLDVSARSVFRSRRVALDRHGDGRIGLQTLDDVESAARIFAATTRRAAREKVGAEHFRLMPAKGIFTLGVGHVRRKTIEPGSKADEPAKMIPVQVVDLSEHEWKVLLALKREFTPEEIRSRRPGRSARPEAGVSLDEFYRVAEDLKRAQNHRAFFNFPRTRETFGGRRARDAIQRAVSLGGAGRVAKSKRAAKSAGIIF